MKNEASNRNKLRIFLEVAHSLNKKRIVPVLFGSLGLYKAIDKLERKTNDIDVLISDVILDRRIHQLLKIMDNLGFILKSKNRWSCDFVKDSEIVSFGKVSDLTKMTSTKLKDLKDVIEDGVRFKELLPQQYLYCYQHMLRDHYRQKKCGNKDKVKIKLIKDYLKK